MKYAAVGFLAILLLAPKASANFPRATKIEAKLLVNRRY